MPIFTWANGESLASVRTKIIGRMEKIIDVKTDFGAVGSGGVDDGPAIQSALNALKTTASPRANALYFPPGIYRTDQVLYITDTESVRIFGDGPTKTVIKYLGSATAGNVEAPGTGTVITPVIMVNGLSYSTISGLQLQNRAGAQTVGIYFYQDWPATSGNTNQLLLSNMLVTGDAGSIATGYLVGLEAGALCSEIMFELCNVYGAAAYGFRNISSNALNNNLYNCGGTGCAVWCSVATGTMNVHGASLAGNGIDIQVSGSNAVAISGCRTESLNFCDVGTLGSANASITGCVQVPGDNVTNGYFLKIGGGSGVSVNGCAATKHPSVTNAVKQSVFTGSNGNISIHDTRIDDHKPFDTLTNVNLYLYGNEFIRAPEPINTCTGQIRDLRGAFTTFATLPTAGVHLKGVRGHITDGSVAASTSNFSSTVAGGGANTVPVWCDGTNWKIG